MTRLSVQKLAVVVVVFFAGFFFLNISQSNLAHGQPRPRPRPTPQGLGPKLKLVSVSLNGGVQKPFDRPGPLPTAIPEFTMPFNPLVVGSFVLEVRTSGGRGTIVFSHSVATNVQQNSFQWVQNNVQPPATGRLRYNFCNNNCPSSFLLEVSARDPLDFTGTELKGQIRINLTASRAAARILGIRRLAGDRRRPQFEITFRAGTFDTRDSQAVARYADGFRYRLVPTNIGEDTMSVVIERLQVPSGVTVTLSNPLGGSSMATELPGQSGESVGFECINCSTCMTCTGVTQSPIGDTASFQHPAFSAFRQSGTDSLPIRPMLDRPARCDEDDHRFTSVRVSILNPRGLINPPRGGPGTVRITERPPRNQPLRAPDNVVRVRWSKPALEGDWWYQVAPSGVDVVGVCSDRVVP